MNNTKIKKTFLRVVVIIITACILLSICGSLVYGADLSTYAGGGGSIGEGEQFTVSFGFSCSEELYGLSADLHYDSSLLTLVSYSAEGPFILTVGTRIVADGQSTTSSGGFASLTFQATSNFTAGQSTTISISSVSGSNGNIDISGSGCSTEVYVSGGSGGSGGSSGGGSNPSGSSDSSLSSLSVTGFKLSPEFSSSVHEYAIEVPFETTALEIVAQANDSNASVSIQNNALKAGKVTDVTVCVTAENGAVTNYIIKTTRKQDPNYISSKNNYLSSLQVNNYLLCPAFDKNIANYVVDVPYSVETIAFTVTTEDPLATFNVLGNVHLSKEDDNIFSVVCTAENNDSRVYTVTVRRAATYDDYLSKTYVNAVVRRINDNEDPVVMNMTNSSVQLVAADIFKALAGKSNSLVVMTKLGSVTFKGSNMEYEINQKYYDLTMLNSSRYSEDILPTLASYQNFVFSTNYKDSLPGYATYSVMTNMLADTIVNVYMFDSSKNEFITVAKSVKTAAGGVVSFELDKGGDFLITTKDIADASNYSSVNRKGNFGFLNNSVIVIILLVICLGIGFAIGYLINNKNKPKKPGGKSSLKNSKSKTDKSTDIDKKHSAVSQTETDENNDIDTPYSAEKNTRTTNASDKKHGSLFSKPSSEKKKKADKNTKKSKKDIVEEDEHTPLEDILDKMGTDKNAKKD